MNTPNDGGPAFPIPRFHTWQDEVPGMSLRDMIEEIPTPVAEVRAKTADEWAELWRVEADSRNELWRSWKALANQHKEAKSEIKHLQDWKASQMAVESEWDAQMLAKKLGAPIGSSCRKEIQERVLSLIEAHSEAKVAIREVFNSFADEDSAWLLDDLQTAALAKLKPFIKP